MAVFNTIGPAQGGFENSSVISADTYQLLRQITGAEVVFKDTDFIKGGIVDFMYKTGSIKDTTTRDIWHFEKTSIVPVMVCNSAITDNGGGSYTFTPTQASNLTFPYNDSVTGNVNQIPPGAGATYTPGIIGEVLEARNGTLRATIIAKNASTGALTVQVGSDQTTAWTALTSGDYVYRVTRAVGERDYFVPGNTQTKNRYGTTMQNFERSTPELTQAELSQARSYTINGSVFSGPEYLSDMLANFSLDEAYAAVLGKGQLYNYTSPAGVSEKRQELLGIIKSAESSGNNAGTIAINATTMSAIAQYNLQNQGGNQMAVWQGGSVQTAVGAFFRNSANGFVNGGIDFNMTLPGGRKAHAVDMDFDAFKINNTIFMCGTAMEFENPRITAGPYNATSDTTVYRQKAVCFPMTDNYAIIDNPVLTSGNKVTSSPFGFNMYYWIQNNFEGRQVGTGRMQEYDQTPINIGAPLYIRTVRASAIMQYIAAFKLQVLSV